MWKVVFIVLSAVFAVGVGAQMVGGFSTIDISDEGAQNALNYAVSQHNSRSNDMYRSQVTDVVKVQRQLVAGYKYVITVRMARTTCRRSSTSEVCDLHKDPPLAKSYECTFTVWSRPWLNKIDVLEEKC